MASTATARVALAATASCSTSRTTARSSARRSSFLSGASRVRAVRASDTVRPRASRASLEIRADVKKAWRSSRSMTLTIKDEDETHDFSTYISDGERIINVTFPDASRRTKIDDTTWQVQLLPFQFMQWRATVVTTLTLEPRGGEAPPQFHRSGHSGSSRRARGKGKVWLSMDGALKPARTANAAGRKVLGKLTVNLSAEVNEMVAMVPGVRRRGQPHQRYRHRQLAGEHQRHHSGGLRQVEGEAIVLRQRVMGDETARGSIARLPQNLPSRRVPSLDNAHASL